MLSFGEVNAPGLGDVGRLAYKRYYKVKPLVRDKLVILHSFFRITLNRLLILLPPSLSFQD
jgi:hypothetical protein